MLAQIDPRTYQAALDQAVAKKAQDEAKLANARLDLARYQKLAATAYTSAQQADTRSSTVAQLEAQVRRTRRRSTPRGRSSATRPSRSPIDGRTGIRQVDPGNIVHATDTDRAGDDHHAAADLGACSPCRSRRCRRWRRRWSEGAPTCWPCRRTPASAARPVLDTGTLTVLDNQVDPTTGTIKLKATFPNEQLQLWPGAFVTVRLQVETRHDATVVPPVAVQRGPHGHVRLRRQRRPDGDAPAGDGRATRTRWRRSSPTGSTAASGWWWTAPRG